MMNQFFMARFPGIASAELSKQWRNPSDVLSLLLIIGGDIIQTALAQMTGGAIVPVCFSFGWVAYAFSSVADLVGKGRLMPEPDFPCKVINLAPSSGHVRENKNWMVGRILRDLETPLDEEALCVRLFDAVDELDGPNAAGHTRADYIWLGSLFTMLAQLGIAAIPCGLYDNWSILMVTAIGTLLALITGALPQWKVEKFAARTNSKKLMALTVGNGSRHIVLIKGNGKTLDFEDLASSQGPKVRRSWDKYAWFQTGIYTGNDLDNKKTVSGTKPLLLRGLPVDFWMTRSISVILAMCWVALLIAVSGLTQDTWYLLAVGALGMAQNAIVAAVSRTNQTRGVHLEESYELRGNKVMDVLMDLECLIPSAGKHLVSEYFPAGTSEKHGEKKWWNGDRGEYDQKRNEDRAFRGVPHSMKTGVDGKESKVSM